VEPSADTPNYHALSGEETLKYFSSREAGLTASDAKKGLLKFGLNQLAQAKHTSIAILFFRQFKDLMIVILLLAVVISSLLGEFADSLIILVILVLNATLSTYQQFRAQQALQALKSLSTPNVSVRRDNLIVTISTHCLVPGDIVILEQGDIVPADIRLLHVHGLQIDESALTGESIAITKKIAPLLAEGLALGDINNMAFKSSIVVLGKASGVVCATGGKTEIGRIASLLTEDKEVKTPLQARLQVFSRYLVMVILCVCSIVLVAGIMQGQPLTIMILTALSLAVAAVPEALPAVITISLALGASKLLKQQALIKNLPAVETLGAVTYICTDKTGTLTENKMQVNQIFDGSAYITQLSSKHIYLGIGMAISNDVEISADIVMGEATEIALFNMALSQGYNKAALLIEYPVVGELPFDSSRKRMTTIHQHKEEFFAFTKGAPEQVIANCIDSQFTSSEHIFERQSILNIVDELSAKGQRIMALAMRRLNAMPNDQEQLTLESNLTFLGLVSISDPIRNEVPAAVKQCISAGIIPVMITGDHKGTAIAIAEQVGLSTSEIVSMNGDELQAMSDADFANQVITTNVYTRVTPEQKLTIVEALLDMLKKVACLPTSLIKRFASSGLICKPPLLFCVKNEASISQVRRPLLKL
jgi:Ca2+-transporting ATPase